MSEIEEYTIEGRDKSGKEVVFTVEATRIKGTAIRFKEMHYKYGLG
jgi:hypothetical protein